MGSGRCGGGEVSDTPRVWHATVDVECHRTRWVAKAHISDGRQKLEAGYAIAVGATDAVEISARLMKSAVLAANLRTRGIVV